MLIGATVLILETMCRAVPGAAGDWTETGVARSRGTARRELELTLTEMEHGEARLPPEERFDVGEPRWELGLPEA